MGVNCFNRLALASNHRLAMPIAVYPGLALTGAKVCDLVTDPQAQFNSQLALHERYHTPFVMSAMDLSAEAEAFGSTVHFSETEIPTVTGRLVTSLEQVQQLSPPQPGVRRTAVYLETVRRLSRLPEKPLVFGGCIGPFSLAARLAGMTETMEMSATDPDLLHALLAKCAAFLIAYIGAFRQSGANGVIMAEPAAGLLSPRSLAQFSSAYVRQIGLAHADSGFALILHNCAAKLVHLPAVLESGLRSFHFGAPMDLPAALARVPADVVLCGNLDPARIFVQSTPAEITLQTGKLLAATTNHRNFVLSSGCDVPPLAPLASLDAFYLALQISPASNC